MTIGELIGEILDCGWVQDDDLTDYDTLTWVFRRSDKPYPIVVDGDLNDVLDPYAYGAIHGLACDH